MKQYKLYIAALIALYTFSSCEKVIDVNIPDGEPLPYIDAWITNKPGKQTIKFLKAVNYLDSKQPGPITDAQVSVTDLTDNKTYDFTYQDGAYNYDAGADAIGIIGHQYKLSVTYNGEQFEATDVLNRVTKIDSITTEFKEADGDDKEGYYAEFYAKDLPGGSDYTWVRTYKNGVLNSYVDETVVIDASFYEDVSDGFTFIEPVREGITSGEKPYQKGDVVKVLLRSVSKPTRDFLDQAMDQMYDGGMFAPVLQNVPTNIANKQTSSKLKIFGWFGTVAEAEMSKTIQ
jgi:Domain of unknown function (DUF4249)